MGEKSTKIGKVDSRNQEKRGWEMGERRLKPGKSGVETGRKGVGNERTGL